MAVLFVMLPLAVAGNVVLTRKTAHIVMAAEFFMFVFHFFVLSAARNTMFQGANRSEKREDILDILPCPDKKSGSKLANEPLPPKGGNGFTTESVRKNKFYSDIKDVDKTDFHKSIVSFVKQIV